MYVTAPAYYLVLLCEVYKVTGPLSAFRVPIQTTKDNIGLSSSPQFNQLSAEVLSDPTLVFNAWPTGLRWQVSLINQPEFHFGPLSFPRPVVPIHFGPRQSLQLFTWTEDSLQLSMNCGH